MSLFDTIFKQKNDQRKAEIYKDLIHHEARIGGQLFGKVPEGTRREFFCLDPTTWVWHEEWTDDAGKHQYMMTRYDVRPGGIVKSQGNSSYEKLTDNELKNFYRAVLLYHNKVSTEYNHILQAA